MQGPSGEEQRCTGEGSAEVRHPRDCESWASRRASLSVLASFQAIPNDSKQPAGLSSGGENLKLFLRLKSKPQGIPDRPERRVRAAGGVVGPGQPGAAGGCGRAPGQGGARSGGRHCAEQTAASRLRRAPDSGASAPQSAVQLATSSAGEAVGRARAAIALEPDLGVLCVCVRGPRDRGLSWGKKTQEPGQRARKRTYLVIRSVGVWRGDEHTWSGEAWRGPAGLWTEQPRSQPRKSSGGWVGHAPGSLG